MGHRPLDTADVQAVIEHTRRNRFCIAHPQADRHLRMRAHERAQQFTDAVIAHGIAGADAQLTAQRSAAFATASAELGMPLQQLLRQRQQFTTARVQSQPAALTRKHGCIQLPLHFGQRHAGSGLSQVQLLGSGAHTAVQRYLHEDLKLAGADIDHQLILYIPSDIPSFPD